MTSIQLPPRLLGPQDCDSRANGLYHNKYLLLNSLPVFLLSLFIRNIKWVHNTRELSICFGLKISWRKHHVSVRKEKDWPIRFEIKMAYLALVLFLQLFICFWNHFKATIYNLLSIAEQTRGNMNFFLKWFSRSIGKLKII